MTTSQPISSLRSNDVSTSNDEEQQSPNTIMSTTSLPNSAARNVSLLGTTNPIFAVLKVTALQQAIGHPVAYARVLIQIGYEPLPACRGKTFFGKESLFYPNVFQYLKYIYNIDGFIGLYRGFGCALLSKLVCWYTTTKVDEILGSVDLSTSNDETKSQWDVCIKKTLREVRCQSWGILLSHPFQVMAIRSMAQFVGREKVYSSINIFQNVQAIYNDQGIGGFFVGLIPRWLLEIATIVISNMIIHILKSQLPHQAEIVPLYEYVAAFIAQTATYPLHVVSTVVAVNGSVLQAGKLPISPVYAHWQDAYKQLGKAEQLKRGSSFFNRIATGTVGIRPPGASLLRRS